MASRRSILALGAAALLPRAARAQGAAALAFSALAPGAPLPGWLEPVTFGGQTRPNAFSLVADEGRTVLRVRSEASASGLARKLRVDPATHPRLSWRWKASRLVAKGRLDAKEGDDFALRLYVTFDLDPATLSFGDRMKLSLARSIWGDHLPIAALCYVWDADAAPGTIAPNAYTDRVRMLVADSGPARLGQWVAHERDVGADFRAAFGQPAPAVTSVILSADTDNTGESAESWFGDVVFSAR
ncbi:MAG: DUF3047 domain-containing protein [Betaproteobacteria bacterium]